MLVLTAKEGEKIRAGDLVVTVCHSQNGKVHLGFDGPREVPVVRENAKRREPKEQK